MRPLYIFDLDGTLANITHRRHYVEGGKKDWDAFHRACVDDAPNLPVLRTLEIVSREADVRIWSGRSDEVWRETLNWLNKYTPFGIDYLFRITTMRRAGDYTPDHELKRHWYDKTLTLADKGRLVAVFDDRDRMVAMWRELGVACFQVAPGDF